MLEILAIVIVTAGVAGLARGKGKDPILAGAIAVGGWVVLRFWETDVQEESHAQR